MPKHVLITVNWPVILIQIWSFINAFENSLSWASWLNWVPWKEHSVYVNLCYIVQRSPVCALLIPIPEVLTLVRDICDGLEVRRSPFKWQYLQENVPFLYDLFFELGPTVTSLPLEYRPIVKEMVYKAELPFLSTPVHPSASVESDVSYPHSCFPNLPVLWKRHVYRLDKKESFYHFPDSFLKRFEYRIWLKIGFLQHLNVLSMTMLVACTHTASTEILTSLKHQDS